MFSAFLSKLPIKTKLTTIIIGICAVTLLSTSAIQMIFNFLNERAQLVNRLGVIAKITAIQSVAPLEFIDPVAAKENLSSIRLQPSISQACIYTEAGVVFASYKQNPSGGERTSSEANCPKLQDSHFIRTWNKLITFEDIQSGNHKVGVLYLEYELTSMYRNLARLWLFNSVIMLGAIMVAYLLSVYLCQFVSRPILHLAERTRQFSLNHDYTIRATKYTDDELGGLAEDFNVMVEELEKHEARLENVIDELKKSNIELERFAYICSHDLQEPLRMVSNYTQMLAKRYTERLDKDALEYMEFIVDGAARMRELISDILVYSRITHAKQSPSRVDLEEIMQQVLGNLALTIKESGAVVTVGKMPAVMGYKALLLQVFQNLINNALKFCKGKVPQITVSARRINREWEFAVQDNGIGIDPLYHEKVFEIFKRLNRREEYKGTGIGLAICKKAVEFHGGRIWISSQVGEGTTFYFTIPDSGTNLIKGE